MGFVTFGKDTLENFCLSLSDFAMHVYFNFNYFAFKLKMQN